MTPSRSPARPKPRTCRNTGLRLIPTQAETVFRIARPSYGALNPPLRPESNVSVNTWGRWDVPSGRTIYTADLAEVAYREVLAYLAPSVGVRNTKLSDVFVEDEGAPLADVRNLLDRIGDEWNELWHIDPRKIVAAWRNARNIYTLSLPNTGWLVDVEAQDSVDALNRGLAQHWSSRGVSRLTRSHLCGDDRILTIPVAQWIHAQTLDDGTLPHGIRFPSKHGSSGSADCCAIWLRRIDDGHDPSIEPTKVIRESAIEDAHHNPDLAAAARALGLIML